MDPAQTIMELGLWELGLGRLGFAPADGRPMSGAVPVPPAGAERYAYVEDYSVVLYREEQDVAGQLSIEIEQNASFQYTFYWKNVDGTPVDLTGAIVRMDIRETKSTAAPKKATLASYSKPFGESDPWFDAITVTEVEGKLEIALTGYETTQIEAGSWFYDIVITISGEAYRFTEGACLVDPGVTP